MSASFTDAGNLFGSEALETPCPLYTAMRSLGPVCQLASSRAFFVGTHAAATEVVLRHEDFSADLERMLVCGDGGEVQVYDLGGAAGEYTASLLGSAVRLLAGDPAQTGSSTTTGICRSVFAW